MYCGKDLALAIFATTTERGREENMCDYACHRLFWFRRMDANIGYFSTTHVHGLQHTVSISTEVAVYREYCYKVVGDSRSCPSVCAHTQGHRTCVDALHMPLAFVVRHR